MFNLEALQDDRFYITYAHQSLKYSRYSLISVSHSPIVANRSVVNLSTKAASVYLNFNKLTNFCLTQVHIINKLNINGSTKSLPTSILEISIQLSINKLN